MRISDGRDDACAVADMPAGGGGERRYAHRRSELRSRGSGTRAQPAPARRQPAEERSPRAPRTRARSVRAGPGRGRGSLGGPAGARARGAPAHVAAAADGRRRVTHARHYTVDQANAALDWVAERLTRLREARRQLTDEEAREALGEAAPGNGGGGPGRVVSEAFLGLQRNLRELKEMEIVLRDLDR